MATVKTHNGYQNMCSFINTCEEVHTNHARYLQMLGATDNDCKVVDCQPAPSWDSAKCHYRIVFTSYLGWKVYMLHTGCFASTPDGERQLRHDKLARRLGKSPRYLRETCAERTNMSNRVYNRVYD